MLGNFELNELYTMFYVFTYNSTKYWITKEQYTKLPIETKQQFSNLAKRDYVGYGYTEWK